MNCIYWDDNFISAFTDVPSAEKHKHFLIQIFVCIDFPVEIDLINKKITSYCIILDSNIEHCFFGKDNTYFTMLIDPTSDLALHLRKNFINVDKGYGTIDISVLRKIDIKMDNLSKQINCDEYNAFIKMFLKILENNDEEEFEVDERIKKVINLVQESMDYKITIKELANKLCISESRLSHLFKVSYGIPLKGYILMQKWKLAYKSILINRNVTRAAMDAGFDSPSHFACTNRRLTGMNSQILLNNSRFLKV